MDQPHLNRRHKLSTVSGVYIPVCLNILSILMFLRFGAILGQIGLIGMLGLLVVSYLVDVITTLSLSAVASNGEVKGGGAYYLISRSLGAEFGGSIGLIFYISQVLNTSLNVVGLIDCLYLNFEQTMPQGYWPRYFLQTAALMACALLSLAGSAAFAKSSNTLIFILGAAIVSIPLSAVFRKPFEDPGLGIEFTGLSLATLKSNLWPHKWGLHYKGLKTFRELFGILFPATSGVFAGASMSGDLRNPSKAIPKGTLWAILTTAVVYLVVILSMASSMSHGSLLRNSNIIQDTNIWPPTILAGECAVTFFSTLMGIIGSAKLMQALCRDQLIPGLSIFGAGSKRSDEPLAAIGLTYAIAQMALFANLNQIATLISMGYQLTFFTMNLACFLLRIASAPNFRPGFRYFSWQSAFAGSVMSGIAMFFIDSTYAATAVCILTGLFLLIHFLSPPKHWGDVSQSLIYHSVRKYLLRLKPEHIKFWRPQIILLINNPRRQTRLIQFCNSMKKGALYILGHVIVTDDFSTGVHEAKFQQHAWTKYISEFSRIKAFVQLTMSPSITWGVRNLILSAGLGGMRPNIVVLGFYDMDELRRSHPDLQVPKVPDSPGLPHDKGKSATYRRRRDTSARITDSFLPTDEIRTEGAMHVTEYLTILEDLALKFRLNVAVGKGFSALETPRTDGSNTKSYIDLWPVQVSAELQAHGKSILTTNFDTYTLILQLGYILRTVPAWKRVYRLRVLVFVEYQHEVDAEHGRVKALLNKLRIKAEILVFWLASGQLSTYESIISGHATDPASEAMVNECLKDEGWWDDLQRYRGRSKSMTASQELDSLANIVKSTAGRPGVFNPHNGPEDYGEQRRQSVHMSDLPKKPTASTLARLGVSMGIHTQSLPPNVLRSESDSESKSGSESGTDSSDDDSDADFNDDASVARHNDLDQLQPVTRPLLASPGRRKNHAGTQIKEPTALRKGADVDKMSRGYGTISLRPPTADIEQGVCAPGSSQQELTPEATMARSATPLRGNSRNAKSDLQMTGLSDPKPSKQIVSGTSTPKGRPGISRANSQARFSSRLLPETTTREGDSGPTVSFAEEETRPRTVPPSPGALDGADAFIDIPELLASKFNKSGEHSAESDSSSGSQGLPLSFNHLPSRAQYLILNELLRQNSSETAVLFTTLPIPVESTCESEEASIRYLSDIEVLCNELPPVLLVHSNNMTVTVSI